MLDQDDEFKLKYNNIRDEKTAYIEVVKAAVIPALLYYIGVWIGVHYEAKKFALGSWLLGFISRAI